VSHASEIRTVSIDGHLWYVGPDGWKHPAVSGGEGPVDPPKPDPEPRSDPKPDPKPESLTQADVDRAARQAVKDAEKALGEKYGMTPEQAKKLAEDRQAAEDAAKDDVTKAQEQAKAREVAADERERKAAAKERAADVRSALLAAGVKPDRLAKAERIVELDDDADSDAITAAVESLKGDTPEWFPVPGQNAPAGLPGNGKPPAKQSSDDLAEFRQRGKQWRESRSGTQTDPFAGFRRAN
jgi:hypothetical protein